MQEDYIGKKFNRLTVLEETHKLIGKDKNKVKYFICKCDCGKIVYERKSDVLKSRIKSCGCYRNDMTRIRTLKHGHAKNGKHTRIYRIWACMKSRCNDKKGIAYKDYGGRGICVCDEWNDSSAFIDWALANGYSDNLTLDRIDVNGNYEPSNCRWITNDAQQNNRRNNVIVDIDGEKHNITEWCRLYDLPEATIKARIYGYGWNPKTAIVTPVVREKRVRAFFPNGEIKEFCSAKEAGKVLSLDSKTIRGACNGYPKTYHKIKWEYIPEKSFIETKLT